MAADADTLESLAQMTAALNSLASGPLSSSAARISGRSRCIPSDKDFHFYNNFPEFKYPARNTSSQSSSLLQILASSVSLWGTKPAPAFPDDLDDSYDWLVNLNDDLLERMGASMDEFKSAREKEEKTGVKINPMEEDGFQLVHGRKRRSGGVADAERGGGSHDANDTGVKMASGGRNTVAGRSKVPFHVPTIPRPQKEFNIVVNNSNRPYEHTFLERSEDGSRVVHPLINPMEEDGFQLVHGRKRSSGVADAERGGGSHDTNEKVVKMAYGGRNTVAGRSKVWFHMPTIPRPQKELNIVVNNSNHPYEHAFQERSEDGSRVVHPLEKLSVLDFVDTNIGKIDPTEPLPLNITQFTFVDGVKGLKDVASKLWDVEEFAVDLEHNQYRSFQGLTCLMQISTRSEDFIIDTLKLHAHVGPYLREVFKDPSKRKVMHGADKDILWLQRDFGIYVCNLFDTGQASRVMQLERNSLEYLLHYFCGVSANKEYQNADWRLRPLPSEMLKYAREDTHYLLYIYDLMRNRLLLASSSENDLLLEVYKRSYEVCMQLYEKELLTDTSYLYIYGLQNADFNSKQLAIASGLFEWRDKVAREEDESTGYILPNKALLEIARQMPTSNRKLHWLVKPKHHYVERDLKSVMGIITSSIKDSSSFDGISEHLKKGRLGIAPLEYEEVGSESLLASEEPMSLAIGKGDALEAARTANTMQSAREVTDSEVVMIQDVQPITTNPIGDHLPSDSRCQQQESPQIMQLSETGCSREFAIKDAEFVKTKTEDASINSSESANKVGRGSVQLLRKTSVFGTFLGNSSSRRKFNPNNGVPIEQEKNVKTIEQIKSEFSLPFYTFSGRENSSNSNLEVIQQNSQSEPMTSSAGLSGEVIQLEEVIPLENESESSESHAESPIANDGQKNRESSPCLRENGSVNYFHSESDMEESSIPLSDLSFKSINERRGFKQNQKPHQMSETNFQLKPFDYDTARKAMKFGEVEGERAAQDDGDLGTESGETRKGSASTRRYSKERSAGFQQARRRQAFPLSGNRSASYR